MRIGSAQVVVISAYEPPMGKQNRGKNSNNIHTILCCFKEILFLIYKAGEYNKTIAKRPNITGIQKIENFQNIWLKLISSPKSKNSNPIYGNNKGFGMFVVILYIS
jgi:hypothetical protein